MFKTLAQLSSLAVFALSVQAGVVTNFNSRAGFGGNDTLQWGTAADEGSTPASPFARMSLGGGSTSTTLPGGFLILMEGSGAGGNFAIGDVLLSTNFQNGPISIAFGSAIRGVGTQIQRNDFGAFNGVIRAYDLTNTLMGTFVNTLGDSNGNQDNSAIFIGLKSSLLDMSRVEIEVTNGKGSLSNDFLINFLSLDTTPGAPIPEPATIGLLGAALSLLVWKRSRA